VTRVIEVRVPDMGNFKDVAVIDVLVKPGDSIEVDGPLITLETEKATMDVPSPVAGVIEKIIASKGGTISPGDVVATVQVADTASAAPATAPAAGAAPAPATPATPPPAAAPAAKAAAAPAAPAAATAAPPAGAGATLAAVDESGFSSAHASPSVRRFARELGVDLARVSGTGFKTRITEEDVKAFVKQVLSGAGGAAQAGKAGAGGRGLPSVPVVDFAAFGAVESKPLTRIQKISGSRLHASWVNLPHVTQFDEADITVLEELRNKLKVKATEQGIKLTPLAFIIRACVRALHHFPTFNSSLDAAGENLILKKYIHMGFAADTPNGLMVPVVRDADRKDIYELARALGELSEKARTGTLNVAQMQGGSFTISSLGGIGGTAFTPIINAPEVAILGVSRAAMKPVFKDGAFVPRLMLPLSLSYDHRVIDGALAAKFTTYLAQVLAEPRGLVEAVP
jgi:pyruvate dehydrogenase E2 component (dihydrolipoamide acetyltransferase)